MELLAGLNFWRSREFAEWKDSDARFWQHNDVLAGWPHNVPAASSWTGAELGVAESYVTTLRAEDILEVETALAQFHASGLDGSEVNKITFNLPNLSRQLYQLADEVHNGRGFVVLRGLDAGKYSPEDNALLFLGLSSYIGEIRGAQNMDKEIFTHIREAKKMSCSQHDRPLKDSRLALTFHTDSFCDILAMQTRACPIEGGKHILASTGNIYNKLAVARPDILATLAQPDWTFDARSPHAQAGQRSLLYQSHGHIMLHFVREPLVGLDKESRFEVKASVSPQQIEALDAIELIARHDQLKLTLQPGDLTFVNNLNTIHSREAWVEDGQGPSRYMVRMWLKNSALCWQLPPALKKGNNAVFDVEEDEMQWNILPTPRTSFKIQELFGP